MMDFPRLVFKDDGPHQRPGGTFDHMLVEDQPEMDTALANGWFASLPEALESHPDPENAPPTRDELEAKATELGIKFDGRLKDKTLADKIQAALEEQKDEEA